MNSLILQTATRILVSLLLIFSIFMLLRGHNAPGGGFVGGLIASTAFALYAIAQGPRAVRESLRIAPGRLAAFGLAAAISAALIPTFLGKPFFKGLFYDLPLGETTLSLSTALLFDSGVFLVVLGAVLQLLLALEEEEVA